MIVAQVICWGVRSYVVELGHLFGGRSYVVGSGHMSGVRSYV